MLNLGLRPAFEVKMYLDVFKAVFKAVFNL